MAKVRIGVLGAARIAPAALYRPARSVPEVEVTAIAARDAGRAMSTANRYGVARVHPDYAALVADPALDAVYVPLPNGLHARWTLAALDAGKHVLCEKPLTANAAQARELAAAASRTGLVVMEAFHYRYHPLMARALEILRGGEIGEVRRVRAALCIFLPRPGDIRYRLDLAGGATMDTGCYAIHCVRTLAGEEPEVVSAHARLLRPGVDRYLRAELRFPGGATGQITCGLLSSRALDFSFRVEGSQGELRVLNYIAPQLFHRLTVRTGAGTRHERVAGEATYTHQLRAFAAAVTGGAPVLTDAADGVRNMTVIDDVYRAAGLSPR
ncbi:MAG TPA: Gfo/Idh/MocA family oxidoreductase [Rugosimonospora sp.]|nr:Gfo/Idh/MocA family oxidoreductase [Rugosimonospora sp.]